MKFADKASSFFNNCGCYLVLLGVNVFVVVILRGYWWSSFVSVKWVMDICGVKV